MKYVIWDIETLINLSTWCFKDLESGKKKEFVFYDDFSQFNLLIEFLYRLKKHDYTLIGFNSINFDAQILEYLLRNQHKIKNVGDLISKIYAEAQRIVSLKDFERFDNLIPEWKLTHKHVDLFKQKHYDGAAKRGTSLKWIQFSTCYENIEEMPISHDTFVKPDDIPLVLSYNWNDVDSTENFFKLIKFETDLRKSLSEKYNLNLINASEPRMAKEIFAKFLSEDMGIDKYYLKQLRTQRGIISIKDVIFPYVAFKTKELQDIKREFESWNVNPNVKKKKGQYEHTFVYNGAKTVVGLGGIHGCIVPGVYKATGSHCIHDIDVNKTAS